MPATADSTNEQAERPIISFEHVDKIYPNAEDGRKALDDINLDIAKGDIFGIIGLSGAGKSTLVRCINGLESVSAGRVLVQGRDIAALHGKPLRALRQRIGMIFQSFNLMPSRTVGGNIDLALTHSGLDKAERQARIAQLLELVELSDKADVFPSDLSGGQRQRVGIARALANNPDILLSDESTSALDPLTTASILDLLKRLNRTLGITIIVITHQMSVVREICNKVAVITQGRIVEQTDVYSAFANPQSEVTRRFVENTSNLGQAEQILARHNAYLHLTPTTTVARLKFVRQQVSEALISQASRTFNTDFNILFADVSFVDDAPLGGTVVAFDAPDGKREAILDYFRTQGIDVSVLDVPTGSAATPSDNDQEEGSKQ